VNRLAKRQKALLNAARLEPPLVHLATENVMGVMDSINERWGRGTLRLASVPTNPDWGMRREMMSQRFTTRVDQLWTRHCK